LQSSSQPFVFAAGDVASRLGQPRPKAGVYAVREGTPLAHNIRAFAHDQPLRPYRAQRRALSIIGSGGEEGILIWGPLAVRSAWCWPLKDFIDRRFMRRFAPLPPPAGEDQGLDGQRMRCNGCAAKIGANSLRTTLALVRNELEQTGAKPSVLDDALGQDDASRMAVHSETEWFQSVDYLPQLVSDPYLFGKIAALHALNDLYAMGAIPTSGSVVIVGRPAVPTVAMEENAQLLLGVTAAFADAGVRLIGGHTAEGLECALGITINGHVSAAQVLHKGGARPGDVLVLTKPLGVGVIFAAEMRRLAESRWIDAAISTMEQSNAKAARLLSDAGATSATDVTGFGMLGHLAEMLAASDCSAELALEKILFLDGALEASERGIASSLYEENITVANRLRLPAVLFDDARMRLLADPQTSGGLLATVPETSSREVVQALQDAGYLAAAIGRILPGVEEHADAPPRVVVSGATSKTPHAAFADG
ncbi:MAG: selenide, water dikinase SelD, partial [Bdellovibrionales bacterium]|nr:selenide, water dikinase SelD [Bdellovibrionales bacterium]